MSKHSAVLTGRGNKAAGLFLLGAGLALGVLFASCENEQLTKDDVKAAVDEGIKNAGAGGKTLESEFKRNLERDGYAVSGSIGGGFTVTCETGNARLTFGGSGNTYPTIPSTMQFNDAAGNQKSYTVQLKLKSGTPDSVSSSTYYLSVSLGSEKALTFDVKIIDQKDNSKQSTTVTLVAKYTEAGFLKAAAASFEENLQSALSSPHYLSITDEWTDKEISAWGQTDAQYSATVKRPTSSSNYGNSITLFTSASSCTVAWTEPTAPPTGVTFSNFSSSPKITFDTSLAAGTIEVPFTLTSAVDSAKTVKGKLILTTKA